MSKIIKHTFRLSNGTWVIPDPSEYPEYYSNLSNTIKKAERNPDTQAKQAGKTKHTNSVDIEVEFEDDTKIGKKFLGIF